jgi:hypothetical protein
LYFVVANVDWLCSNFKERKYVMLGEFTWTLKMKKGNTDFNEDGIIIHEIKNIDIFS